MVFRRGSDISADDARAFLQRRIAMAGLVAAALSLTFLVFRAVSATATGYLVKEVCHPSFALHALAALCFLALWLVCRSGRRSTRFAHRVEAVGWVVGCVCYQIMGAHMPPLFRPDLVVLLALNFALVARAVYVPSSARRTLLLGVVIGVPFVAIQYLSLRDFDASVFMTKQHLPSGVSFAVMASISAAVWWLLVVLLCTAASKVIYGLREELRDVRRLGQYTIEQKLGEGGMGMVYRARHAMLRRPTAVKLLPPDRADEQDISRFEREVQLTAELTHPHTVTIYDYGRTPEGIFYYAMELLEGGSLHDVVRVDGPQPAARVIHILAQAAAALEEAHGVGLIHRDVKPANILLAERGGRSDFVKVVDFGLVKPIRDAEAADLTAANAITGTPQYLAPEAITRPDSVDARSDLYALGAVGYFLLAGRDVFEGGTLVEICSHHLHSEPEPPSEKLDSVLASDLEQLLMACLAKKPSERPQNAAELRRRLGACQDAGRWTEADARAWWNEHGARLRQRREQQYETASARTIAIDLVARKTA